MTASSLAENNAPQSSPSPSIDLGRVAQRLKLAKAQVRATVELLDAGNTVPFITRYRKDRTGGLDEEQIRAVQQRVAQLKQIAQRKDTILRSIQSQGKLTDELKAEILKTNNAKRLEDLYLPYRPKKETLATTARHRGLGHLADEVLAAADSCSDLEKRAADFVDVDKKLPTAADVLLGTGHVLAETFSERADLREALRAIVRDTGKLTVSKIDKADAEKAKPFHDYFKFSEAVGKLPHHRLLAINRGERVSVLRVKIEMDEGRVREKAEALLLPPDHPHSEFLKGCIADALARLVMPSLERELRRELADKAETHSVTVFAQNLRGLLLQPPVRGEGILSIDPGFKNGCKIAALDATGQLLEHAIVYLIGSKKRRHKAKLKIAELLCKHKLQLIAIGNGTACRETEQLVAEIISGEVVEPTPATDAPSPEAQPPAANDAAQDTPTDSAPAAEAAPAEPTPGETESPAEPTPLEPIAVETESPAELATAEPEVVETNPVEAAASAEPVTAAPEETNGEPVTEPIAQPEVAAETSEAATDAAPAQPAVAAKKKQPAENKPAPLAPLPEIDPEVRYVIVNEAGASVYSTSQIAREELPNYDATIRGTVSIGRRLLDPLAELVKIDPASIGVGLYQHDVKGKHLESALDEVVQSCVNYVGVDLNTASPSLLRYVSGLNQLTARRICEHRSKNGPFTSRDQLKSISGFGDATYEQAAGFLKIRGGENPLDATWIHPESYTLAEKLLQRVGVGAEGLSADGVANVAESADVPKLAEELEVGNLLLSDILTQLARPGRDPRETQAGPIYRRGVLKIEDLAPGMELTGTVLNVVDFGVFVDIGMHDSGLVHISHVANRYVSDPHSIVSVGDPVKVWVESIDPARRRVALTMIPPGTPKQTPRPRRGKSDSEPEKSRGERPRRRGGKPSGKPTGGRSSAGKPHQQRSKPKPRKPVVPITDAMKKGNEPMRSFGDLIQFVSQDDDKPAGKGAAKKGKGNKGDGPSKS